MPVNQNVVSNYLYFLYIEALKLQSGISLSLLLWG